MRLALLATAVALASALASGAEPYPPPFPGNPVPNGDFSACYTGELSGPPSGPALLRGDFPCPPWIARASTQSPSGGVPRSRIVGLVSSTEGHVRTMQITYDAADSAIAIETTLAAPPLRAVADPTHVTFAAKSSASVVMGAHLVASAGPGAPWRDVAPYGSPVALPATNLWTTFTLAFPPGVGDVGMLVLEIAPTTPHGARIEIDDVALHGAYLAPRVAFP